MFDRSQSPSLTILLSASRTTTQTSADIPTGSWQGLHAILDMTVVGTGSVTLTINGKDPLSGKYYLLLAGAAVVGNGTNVYKIFPSATPAANAAANDTLPAIIQLVATANNANAAVYSVGVNFLP